MREYTRYAIQEIVQPLEYEKIISEIIFNLGHDLNFPDRLYPDIRYIGGNKDYGHDAISITWEVGVDFSKKIFAFSKRKDWGRKLEEDLLKHKCEKNIDLFVYITTERVGSKKLPENLVKFKEVHGFAVEIIDVEDIVIWLDNTSWGKSIKRKYSIGSEDVFIYLKPYEIALQNNEVKEEVFRTRGPIEIDFAKGMIFRREEVDSIKENILENRIHLIIGPPASGKTVLARNICFELNKSFEIYWLEMDDLINDPTRVYIEIQRLNCTNSLIVVENGHKSKERLENTINFLLNNTKQVRMLVTMRNIDINKGQFYNINNLINENNKTEIDASDISNKLILFYADMFGKKIGHDISEFLPYEQDLWMMNYLIKMYIDTGIVDECKVSQIVRDELVGYDERIGIGASDIILITSLITQNSAMLSENYHEKSNYLPIDDFLLIDFLGYDPKVISSLIAQGIIKKMIEGYWCWHTSLSKIYTKTAELYPHLLTRVNSKFKKILGDSFDEDPHQEMNINIFHIYLHAHPEHADRIITITSKSGLLCFKWQNIFNNLSTRELIYENLRKSNLAQIRSLGHIINTFSYYNDKELIYSELIQELGPDRIRDKLSTCKNPYDLVLYAYLIYRMNKIIGRKIINGFKDNILNNIKNIRLDLIGDSLDFLSIMNSPLVKEIINKYNLPDCDSERTSTHLNEVAFFLRTLDRVRIRNKKIDSLTNWDKICQKFVDRNWTQIIYLISSEKEEQSIGTILNCVSSISHIYIDRGRDAANVVDIPYIFLRLNEIDDLDELRYVIFSAEYIYPELKEIILERIAKIIENEIKNKGIYSVAYFFGNLFKDSRLLDNGKKSITIILDSIDENIIITMKKSNVYPFCEFEHLEI